MCPAAAARTASPAITKPQPAAIHIRAGRANHKYAAAKTKPRGTRNRVAILPQLGMGASQEVADRANDLIGPDLQQSLIRVAVMRERCDAFRVPQRNRPVAKGAGADGIGGPEQANDGDAQGRGQMHWPGVAAKSNASAACESDQLPDRAAHRKCISAAGLDHRSAESFFAGPNVDQRFQVVPGERLSD